MRKGLASICLGIGVFIEQLRCNYDVSELFEEKSVLSPTKPAANSGLDARTMSTVIGLVTGLCVLPRCGPRRPLLEETPD